MNYTTPQEDVLGDIQLELEYETASTGQRFANYLIDAVAFYIVLISIAFILALAIPGFANILDRMDEMPPLLDRLFGLILYGVYMGILEGLLKGRSFGKYITRTKAVLDSGENIDFSKAMFRGLCRMVPFEALSAFGGYPWHDKWTGTRVVKVKS